MTIPMDSVSEVTPSDHCRALPGGGGRWREVAGGGAQGGGIVVYVRIACPDTITWK